LNDVQFFEAARGLATRMLSEGGANPSERIALGYRIVLARLPDAEELAIVSAALDKHLAEFRAKPEAARQALRVGESPAKAGLDEAELAAYTLLANLLLNLDEAVTRN
jgi:hypothetical protein